MTSLLLQITSPDVKFYCGYLLCYNPLMTNTKHTVLNEEQNELLRRERQLFSELLEFLRSFDAPRNDIELVEQTLSDLE